VDTTLTEGGGGGSTDTTAAENHGGGGLVGGRFEGGVIGLELLARACEQQHAVSGDDGFRARQAEVAPRPQAGDIQVEPRAQSAVAHGLADERRSSRAGFGDDELIDLADHVASAVPSEDTTRHRGAEQFAKFTSEHTGEYFAITLDGTVISAPVIQNAIPNGQVQISAGGIGGFPAKEANELVTVLKFGSLPFPIQELSTEEISATLGEQFLNQSLLAGLIGISLVVAFMLLYYRLPGLVASFALIYYTLVVIAIFRLIPVTLTLAGIAVAAIRVER